MGLFRQEPGERILLVSDAQWLRSWWRRPYGVLYFTTQRLVFELNLPTQGHAGVVAVSEMRNRFPIEIGRDGLNAVNIGMHKHRQVLQVKTDYELLVFADISELERMQKVMHAAIESDREALAELVQRLEQNAAQGPTGDPYRGSGKKR